jgi:6-pyruvoyltetrahydropterin/6-carboxytetrahydropterin synthase
MVYVTRRMVFAASHRLHNPEWSAEKNYEVFDKCNNPNGHGHNYVMEVTVSGKQEFGSGYLIDLKILKRIITEVIIDKVDHKNLNLDVEFLKGIIPSVENLAVVFWEELQDKFDEGIKLTKIKLWETENNSIEYMGEPIIIKRFNDFIK